MADIYKISIGGSVYDIKDETSRSKIPTNEITNQDYKNNNLLITGKNVDPNVQTYRVTLEENSTLRKVFDPSSGTFFGNTVNDVCAALTIVNEYLKNHDAFYYDMSVNGKGGFIYNGTYDDPVEDTPTVNQSGQKAMNCAVFTNLILQGVPYTFSTYKSTQKGNLATNPIFAPAMKNAIAYSLENQNSYPNLSHSGLYTWKLARYLYDMGVLRPVGNNIAVKTGLGSKPESTYNAGDILFFGTDAELENRFMGINHCAILIGYIGSSDTKTNMLVAECSSNNSGNLISALKVRTLRADADKDNVVATFSPAYNNGFNLSAQPRFEYDTNVYGFATNLVVKRDNVPCVGESNAIDVNTVFSGIMNDSFMREHRGAYMLVVDPIYTSAYAATKWYITYTNELDEWSNNELHKTAHTMVSVGKIVLPIPYGVKVSLYTDSNYVSGANLKMNIVSSDKFLNI